MLHYLVEVLAKRLRKSDDTVSALAFLTAKGRVAYALLDIAETFGENTESGGLFIREMINQKDLAAIAGVARENTNRILKEWAQKKLITMTSRSHSSRSYLINNKAKLEREMQRGSDAS
jgi:CRP-like cAMP-binding protein